MDTKLKSADLGWLSFAVRPVCPVWRCLWAPLLSSLLGAHSILYRVINKTWHFFFFFAITVRYVTGPWRQCYIIPHGFTASERDSWERRALLCPSLHSTPPQWLWTGHLSVLFTPGPHKAGLPWDTALNGSPYVRTHVRFFSTIFNHSLVWQIIIIHD